MAPEVIACDENPDATYDYRVRFPNVSSVQNLTSCNRGGALFLWMAFLLGVFFSRRVICGPAVSRLLKWLKERPVSACFSYHLFFLDLLIPLNLLTFLHRFFQLFATCTPCVHSSSFQEILLLGWNLKNGEHHPERTFLLFTYLSYIIASLPCKILTHLLWDILCTDFLLFFLCAFCFMSDLSPGSYRDLNLRAQLSLSALLLTRTSVVHLLWQAQALLALAQTHWIAALDCTAETSQSSNALMNWLSFYICLQTEIAVLFYTPPLFHKISVWFAAVASESDGARQQVQLW